MMDHGDDRRLDPGKASRVDRAKNETIDDERHLGGKRGHGIDGGRGFGGTGLGKTAAELDVVHLPPVAPQRLEQFIFVDIAAGLLGGVAGNGEGGGAFDRHVASCSLAKVFRMCRSRMWTRP